MKKIIIFYILIINYLIGNDWVEHKEGIISSNGIVIMFTENTAPSLGQENPINLSDFPALENIVFKYGIATLYPLFSNYNKFTENHHAFSLHQYYKLVFDTKVDVITLIIMAIVSQLVKKLPVGTSGHRYIRIPDKTQISKSVK